MTSAPPHHRDGHDLVSTDVNEAVRRLRLGGLVAIATETVYGLGADIAVPEAVDRIFETKGRPRGHPLIIHVADVDIARRYGVFNHTAATLAAACWPGPITLLVPRTDQVPDAVTGGRDTVGIRVPAHDLTAEVLRRHGGAIAAPSANRFGEVSPTSVAHVVADLGALLNPHTDLILDGGASAIGVESSIVDTTSDPPQLLRPGAITTDDIDRLIGHVDGPSGPSRAAGMLAAHYAPACTVLAVDHLDEVGPPDISAPGVRVLDLRADVVAAARDLYTHLRMADTDDITTLVVVMSAPHGLGHAVRDRVTKAAAGRQQPGG